MKVIDVTGFRYGDIVIYLAELLERMGEKVCVRDATADRQIYSYLPDIEGCASGDEMEFRGVSFAAGTVQPPEGCDYCFNLLEPALRSAVSQGLVRLYVTDEDKAHEQCIYEILELSSQMTKKRSLEERGTTVLLLRDYMGYISRYGVELAPDVDIDRIYKLPYSEKDRRAELYLTVRQDTAVRPVSEKLCEILEELVRMLRPGTGTREFDRAYRSILKEAAA